MSVDVFFGWCLSIFWWVCVRHQEWKGDALGNDQWLDRCSPRPASWCGWLSPNDQLFRRNWSPTQSTPPTPWCHMHMFADLNVGSTSILALDQAMSSEATNFPSVDKWMPVWHYRTDLPVSRPSRCSLHRRAWGDGQWDWRNRPRILRVINRFNRSSMIQSNLKAGFLSFFFLARD